MSSLTNIFHLSVFGLSCLASMTLASAEGRSLPYFLSIPLAVTAYFVTERKKIFYLPLAFANGLGILAFLLAAGELFFGTVEARVLSGAHLLVYLSWIVYFQEKDAGQFWWMCVLGILQVTVGSLLTTDGVYGMLLIIYLFCGIWTLSVYSMFQGRQQFLEAHQGAEPAFVRPPAGSPSLLAAVSEAGGGGFGLLAESESAGVIRLDPNERWVNHRLVLGTVGLSLTALGIAGAFFATVPRVWLNRQIKVREDPTEAVISQTGFTNEVTLGDLGTILGSTRRVLQLRIFDMESGEELDVSEYAGELGYDEPLLRGSVMSEYRAGKWMVGKDSPTNQLERRPLKNGVRQEFHMEPMGTDVLFAVFPVRRASVEGTTRKVRQLALDHVLLKPEKSATRGQVVYTVYSPREIPESSVESQSSNWPRAIPRYTRQDYTALPEEDLAQLIALAREKSGFDEAAGRPSDRKMARRLEAYLRDSGEFGYSLTNTVQDRSIDPIEDFLLNRKQGHCEYFASALALMLRAVDIPARLVNGFKGGEVNSFSGDFEVQERHAHAWVEAAIDGRWVILDPTPFGARSESVQAFASSIQSWYEFVGYIKQLWTDNIVNMSFVKQQERVYVPLKKLSKEWWLSATGGEGTLKGALRSLKRFLSSPERWFSWQGAAITWLFLFFIACSTWAVKKLLAWIGRVKRRLGIHPSDECIRVEFYERFRALCESRGLERGSSQTQREHARSVVDNLNGMLVDSDLEEMPGDVVALFYRIRFGTGQLQREEIRRIDSQLSRFEKVLAGA